MFLASRHGRAGSRGPHRAGDSSGLSRSIPAGQGRKVPQLRQAVARHPPRRRKRRGTPVRASNCSNGVRGGARHCALRLRADPRGGNWGTGNTCATEEQLQACCPSQAVASEASLTGESAPQMKDALAFEDRPQLESLFARAQMFCEDRCLELHGSDRVHCLFSGHPLTEKSMLSYAP